MVVAGDKGLQREGECNGGGGEKWERENSAESERREKVKSEKEKK